MHRLMLSWLDVKLAGRMLVKYPGLTLAGGIAITAAIAIGAVFDVAAGVVDSALPLDEGDRIVAIENWDAEINNQDPQILHDFVVWRDALRSVRELGAFRTVGRNLIVPGTPAEIVSVAEMTASGFRVARIAPLMGRTLIDDDEREGTPPVLVISAEIWRTRFDSDAAVVGREVRLGDTLHTVVGVMPDGFAFPMNHGLWTALRANPLRYERRQGPALSVFGRLAPGATLEQAQTELAAIGQKAAVDFPSTHHQLRPRVVPYTAQLFDDMEGWEIPTTRVFLALLLAVLCINIAVLVYARTATRETEMVVRSALGASRRRIVAQLFIEAFVLSGAAAAAGLLIAGLSLRRLDSFLASLTASRGGLPFWIELSLSPRTIAYAFALALVAAVVVGVIPAMSATGRRLQSRLGHPGSGAGMRLGRTWTVLIVSQVAVAAAALPTTMHFAWQFVRYGLAQPGFAAEEFVTASLVMDRDIPPSAEAGAYEREYRSRYAARLEELARRLQASPEVSGVTFTSDLPGQEPTVSIEIEAATQQSESASSHRARFSRVMPGFFDVLGVRTLAGRPFQPQDLSDSATAVIVNGAFAREILKGGNPVGRRFRYAEGYPSGGVMRTPAGTTLGQWYEIVGVVGDVPPNAMQPRETTARIYHPLAPGELYPVHLALRTRVPSATVVARLQEVSTAVDPTLQLRDVQTLDEAIRMFQGGMRMGALALGLMTLSVLVLSAAGIYALMAFTITQRRREIGIRSALGATPRHILGSVFRRAAGQLAMGLAVGAGAAAVLAGVGGGRTAALLPVVVAILIALVGLLATIGPARQVLHIETSETLKAEG
jgi:predicted permease